MKRWIKGLAAAGLASLLTVPAFASFSDVPSNAWYANDVEAVQEYGIINGVGNNRFDPNGTLTYAEALTMAARTHAYLTGKTIPQAEGPWYQGALEYDKQNGIITEDDMFYYDFFVYNDLASRGAMAYMFSNALPDAQYAEINVIAELPDVSADSSYGREIIRLYKAGILTGSDEYGTFNQYDKITRAETAAILNRVVTPSVRVKLKLKEQQPPKSPDGLSWASDGSNIGKYSDAIYPKEGDILNGVKVERDPATGVLGYGVNSDGVMQKGGIYLGIPERIGAKRYRTIEVGTRAIDTYDGMSAGNIYRQIGDYIFWDGEWGKILEYARSKMPTASAIYVGKGIDINGNVVSKDSGETIFYECVYNDVLGFYSWIQTF